MSGLDARVETVRVAAQAQDLPAVGEEATRDVAAADAGDADDEGAPAHGRPGVRAPVRRTWL